MAKQRRRVVPARRVRLQRGEEGWELVKQVDVPATPIPQSADRPGSGAFAEAVDAHGECIHRLPLDPDDEGVADALVPIDARIVGLDLYDAGSDEPVAHVDLRAAGSGAPSRLRR